jgi:hypothetical protein
VDKTKARFWQTLFKKLQTAAGWRGEKSCYGNKKADCFWQSA